MAQFDHKNVLSLVGVVTVGKPLLVVIQYCKFGSLSRYLHKMSRLGSAILTTRKVQMALDLATGMCYLSEHRFVHRDLAARNVLVASDNSCVVADFGMSQQFSEESPSQQYYRMTTSGMVPARWTAAEVFHTHKFSQATDVWSFGVLRGKPHIGECCPSCAKPIQSCRCEQRR
jgi:serine/threonine protein kinase